VVIVWECETKDVKKLATQLSRLIDPYPSNLQALPSSMVRAAENQKLVGADIYQASRDIKDLIGKGLVKLPRKGGRIYELLPVASGATAEKPPEYVALEAVLKENGFIKNEDIRKILRVSVRQATRIASRLVADGWLRSEGYLKMRRYFQVT